MKNDPILAHREIRAEHTNKYKLDFTVLGGLHYISGNSAPYFSLTCNTHRKGFENQVQGGGANHELILKYYPQFADLAALHGSDINGAPMYAFENGWYWLSGSLGGLGEKYAPNKGHNAKSESECLNIFTEHCRISIQDAEKIKEEIETIYAFASDIQSVAPYSHEWDILPDRFAENARKECKTRWKQICDDMRPRWKQEADACILKHNLVVYGDKWEK